MTDEEILALRNKYQTEADKQRLKAEALQFEQQERQQRLEEANKRKLAREKGASVAFEAQAEAQNYWVNLGKGFVKDVKDFNKKDATAFENSIELNLDKANIKLAEIAKEQSKGKTIDLNTATAPTTQATTLPQNKVTLTGNEEITAPSKNTLSKAVNFPVNQPAKQTKQEKQTSYNVKSDIDKPLNDSNVFVDWDATIARAKRQYEEDLAEYEEAGGDEASQRFSDRFAGKFISQMVQNVAFFKDFATNTEDYAPYVVGASGFNIARRLPDIATAAKVGGLWGAGAVTAWQLVNGIYEGVTARGMGKLEYMGALDEINKLPYSYLLTDKEKDAFATSVMVANSALEYFQSKALEYGLGKIPAIKNLKGRFLTKGLAEPIKQTFTKTLLKTLSGLGVAIIPELAEEGVQGDVTETGTMIAKRLIQKRALEQGLKLSDEELQELNIGNVSGAAKTLFNRFATEVKESAIPIVGQTLTFGLLGMGGATVFNKALNVKSTRALLNSNNAVERNEGIKRVIAQKAELVSELRQEYNMPQDKIEEVTSDALDGKDGGTAYVSSDYLKSQDEATKEALGVTDAQIAANRVVAVDTSRILSLEDKDKRAEVLGKADYEDKVAETRANIEDALFKDIDRNSTIYQDMQDDIEGYYAQTRTTLEEKYTAEQADKMATISTSLMFNLSRLSGKKFRDFVALNPVQINFGDDGKITSFTLDSNVLNQEKLYQDEKNIQAQKYGLDRKVEVVKVIPQKIKTAEDAKALKEKSKLKELANLIIGAYYNEDIGKNIELNISNVSHAYNALLKNKVYMVEETAPILEFLPSLIKNAKEVEQHNDRKQREQVEKIHRLYACAEIGDSKYVVKLTVKELKGKYLASLENIYRAHDTKVVKKMSGSSRRSETNGNSTSLDSNGNTPDTVILQDLMSGVKLENGETLLQSVVKGYPQSGKRGSISLAKRVNAGEVTTINLTGNADVSTVMHEMAHFALNYLKGINATPQLTTLGNWWTENVSDILKGTDCTADDLNAFIEEIKTGTESENLTADKRETLSRATQEYFARGFEAYLREGKSPNAEMRSIFRRMRDWIVAVYKSFAGNLNVNLNDEVRGLFDSLVAGDTAIDTEVSLTSTQLTDEAIYTAKEILFRRLVSELKGDHQREIAIFREERAPQIREELENQPRYVVTQKIKDYGGIDRSTVPTEIADRLPKDIFSAKDGEGIDWEMAFAVAHDYNEEGTYETEADFVEDIEDLMPIADALDEQLNLETKALFNSLIENYDEMSLRAEDTLHNGIDDVGDNIAVSTVASYEEAQDIEGQPEAEETEETPQGETLYQDEITPEQEEYNAIEEKYRNTDEWMKAPNGKPTNLTERQWVQVRTKSFARWFGNWNYNPNTQVEAVDLTGIVDSDNVNFDNVKTLRRWLIDKYVDGTVTIDSDGSIVNFTTEKIKASVKRKSRKQIAAYRALGDLIEKSVFFDFEPRDDKPKHEGLYGQDIYYSYMIFDGRHYAVRFKIDVDKADRSLTYKDHKVTAVSIEEKALANAGDLEKTSNPTPPRRSLYVASLQQLTKGVKPNCSKILDENGEPKVVYHGTPSGGFEVFRDESYFTGNKSYAENYRDKGIYKEHTPQIYDVFLNIKKPFDTKQPSIRDIFYNEFYQKWGNGAELQESGYPDWTDASDLLEFIAEEGYDFDGLIIDEGADGGYGEDVTQRGVSYVPVNPNQIKSATDNTGAFNNDNPNILYQDDVWEYGEDITPEEEALITENESQFLDETEEVLNTLTNQDIGVLDEEGNNKFDEAEAAEEANAPMHTKEEVAHALKTAQIAYSEVVRTHGKEKAQELKKRYPGIFSKKGGTLDEANALLQEESGINVAEDGDGLFDFLMSEDLPSDNTELEAYRQGKQQAQQELAREKALLEKEKTLVNRLKKLSALESYERGRKEANAETQNRIKEIKQSYETEFAKTRKELEQLRQENEALQKDNDAQFDYGMEYGKRLGRAEGRADYEAELQQQQEERKEHFKKLRELTKKYRKELSLKRKEAAARAQEYVDGQDLTVRLLYMNRKNKDVKAITVECLRNEREEGRKAKAAWHRGDFETYKQHKEEQLYWHEVNRILLADRIDLQNMQTRLSIFGARKSDLGMDVEYQKVFDWLLAKYGFKKRGYGEYEAPFDGRFDQWVNAKNEVGQTMSIADSILDMGNVAPWSDLPITQAKELFAAINTIREVGRERDNLLRDGKKMATEYIADLIVDGIVSSHKDVEKGFLPRTVEEDSQKRKLRRWNINGLTNMETICQLLDGMKDGRNFIGAMQKYFFNPLRNAVAREGNARAEYIEKVYNAIKKHLGKVNLDNFKKIDLGINAKTVTGDYIKETFKLDGKKKQRKIPIWRDTNKKLLFTKQQLFCIALNMGNSGNIQRFRDGFGLSDDEMQKIIKAIPQEYFDCAQEIGNIINELWQPMIETYKKSTKDYRVKKVNPVPITIKGKTYDGWYYPISYDHRSIYNDTLSGVEVQEANKQRELDMADLGQYLRYALPTKNFTKSRLDAVYGIPLNLNITVLEAHIANTLRFIHLTEEIQNARKILNNAGVKSAIIQAYGTDVHRTMLENITSLAVGKDIMHLLNAQEDVKRFFDNLIGSSMANGLLAFRLRPMLMQMLGLFASSSEIGIGGFARAVWEMRHFNHCYDFVMSKSEFMKSQNVDMIRLKDMVTTLGRAKSTNQEWGMRGYQFFQNFANVPTWAVAYRQELARNGGNEAGAVAYADMVVRTTQSANNNLDKNSIEKMAIIGKFFFAFNSYPRVVWQNFVMRLEDIANSDHKVKTAVRDLWSYAVSYLMLQGIAAAFMRGDLPDEDDDKDGWLRWLIWTAKITAEEAFQAIPFTRPISMGYGSRGINSRSVSHGGVAFKFPALRLLEDFGSDLFRTVGNIWEGEFNPVDDLFQLLNDISALAGASSQQEGVVFTDIFQLIENGEYSTENITATLAHATGFGTQSNFVKETRKNIKKWRNIK